MASTKKTVCVIGAGPSGLIAAKSLAASNFTVTIFEATSRIGGLWPLAPSHSEDCRLVNPDMCTNQSKHTVSFSDLAWEEDKPQFPKAWLVGQYLERYRRTYGLEVELEKKVETVVREEVEEGWRVKVGGEEEARGFDHVVVATGFFGSPKMPKEAEGAKVPVVHSSEVRDVKSLVGEGKGRNILVVGGQMSGFETAASLALQLSSLTHSPGESGVEDVGRYRVVHVVQKPVWVMPLFYPKDPNSETKGEDGEVVTQINPSPTFLPLDLVVYNISWRPPGPVLNTSGHITTEAAQQSHDFMQTYIGHDQSDLEIPALTIQGDVRSEPPMLAVSDRYHEFVRHGNIKVAQGRLREVAKDSNTAWIADPSGNAFTIPDLAAIVCATGFDASTSLNFLPADLLDKLQFQPNEQQGFPLALNVHSSISKDFPTLGFVGYYRSPYWGVMEMQARYLAKLWSGDEKCQNALEEDTTLDTLLSIRTDPRRSQFPMGDYAYLMESFAEILGIQCSEPAGGKGRTGLVLPPRYLFPNASEIEAAEAKKALTAVETITASSSTSGHFVARAVFRGLQGIWTLSRTITSQITTFPSGTLSGTASFHPRIPTLEGADMEYLYFEEGDFSPSWGGVMKAKRSYVYHYTESSDTLDVWFAKGDYKTSDYFFHRVKFVVDGRNEGEGWRGKSSHLCIDDMYEVTYEFFFQRAFLDMWKSRYEVKGPKKDYIIENEYTRPGRVQ